MPKIRILSPAERKAFQSPPVFQSNEKANYFGINDAIKIIVASHHSPYRKVGFILQIGYFRRVGRFFNPAQFHQQDVIYVSKLLDIDHRNITFEKYKDHRLRHDQQKILEMIGFQSFDSNDRASELLSKEITRLVEKQIRPKMIIYYLSHFFFQKKIETPSYQLMAEITLQEIERYESKLFFTLENNLTKQHMHILDQLLPKVDTKKSAKNESYYSRAPLIALREFPLSSRPGKIKKSIDDFLIIKSIFESTQVALQSLSLSPNALKYYAVWTQKAKITQLVKVSNPYKRYLYLLAFIAHQYHYRQDLLGDTLLQSVQSTLNRIEKKQEEEDKNIKQEKERATHLLSMSYRDKTELLQKIHSIINTGLLSSEEKVTQIKELVSQEDKTDPTISACIEKLDNQIFKSLNRVNFYTALENQSIKLQKRLSCIIKNLDFNVMNSKSSLLEAIRHFRKTDGQIGQNPPQAFLKKEELIHILDSKNKVRPSLYKSLLFVHIADAIKSGEINLTHSYRYLSIDEYLITKKTWQMNKKDLLDRAGLTTYSSAQNIIVPIRKKLDMQYRVVNESINSGKNSNISFNKAGEIIVETPKVEKIETLRIAELLKQER